MKVDKKLLFIAAVTYLLVTYVGVYFKSFPTIVSPLVTNLVLFGTIFLFISFMVYGVFLIKSPRDFCFLLPQMLFFIFIARAVPNLRLPYPPLLDPYYYFITTLNVVEYGTLQPVLKWWYPLVGTQLDYPALPLLTTTLTKLTGIAPSLFVQFLNPVLGLLFFFGVYLLAKEITRDVTISLLAAFFSSLVDVIIFYQSEYHPQGLAFTVFIFLIYAFLKFNKAPKLTNFLLVGLFTALLVILHHFTSIFIALIFILYPLLLFVYSFTFVKDMKISVFLKTHKTNLLVVGCYLAFVLIYNLIFYKWMAGQFYKMVESSLTPLPIFLACTFVLLLSFSCLTGLAWRTRNFLKNYLSSRLLIIAVAILTAISIPFLFYKISGSIFHYLGIYKVFLFLPAFVYLLKYGLTGGGNHCSIILLFLSLIFGGVGGFYLIQGFPLDRVIGFATPFACIFTSVILCNFYRDVSILPTASRKLLSTSMILIASGIISLSFFNSQIPSFFFKDSGMDITYWYSNQLPSMVEYKIAGEWLGKYTSKKEYNVDFSTLVIPLFYGKKPASYLRYNTQENWIGYTVIGLTPPYMNNTELKEKNFDEQLDRVYDNHEVRVYKVKHLCC